MKRVAVVEDNADNRMLVEALLSETYEVELYAQPEAALEALALDQPDVVLMDISLPRMDGMALLDRLRETAFGSTPVIALTAHAMDGDRERFLAHGFDGYLSKPIVDEDLLLAAIAQALSASAG